MSTEKPIRIYSLGGTGANISRYFEKDLAKGIHSMTYVDTSRSNIKDSVLTDENIYIFKNEAGQELDGAGKKRDTHAKLIQQQTPDILNKHAPAKFNIVVFGLAGGSGSVAGPVLVNSLIARGEKVVACVVGSFKDATQAVNTSKTLKGLALVSQKYDKPVVVSYHSNSEMITEDGKDRLKSEEEINDDIREVISHLCILFSGENDRLDSADLTNLLNYPDVTGIPASVAELETFMGYDWVREMPSPLVSCTLYPQGAPQLTGVSPLYSCDGYVPEGSPLREPVTFVVHSDRISGIINKIAEEEKRYGELRAARTVAPAIASSDDKDSSADGYLVL